MIICCLITMYEYSILHLKYCIIKFRLIQHCMSTVCPAKLDLPVAFALLHCVQPNPRDFRGETVHVSGESHVCHLVSWGGQRWHARLGLLALCARLGPIGATWGGTAHEVAEAAQQQPVALFAIQRATYNESLLCIQYILVADEIRSFIINL